MTLYTIITSIKISMYIALGIKLLPIVVGVKIIVEILFIFYIFFIIINYYYYSPLYYYIFYLIEASLPLPLSLLWPNFSFSFSL